MQHLRTVRSWKFRLLKSNLGLLHKEWLQKAYSQTLSEFRSSYSAISCKARTNIQASIQSKNQCHFPWQWEWCLERIFQVVYTLLESESSFKTLTTSSALFQVIPSLIPETPLGLAPPFPYTYCFYKPYSFPGHLAHQRVFALPLCFSSNRKSSHFP